MTQIAYTEKRPRCQICHYPSFGVFVVANLVNGALVEELQFLCSSCSFNEVGKRNGWGTKKFKSIKLEVIFKLPQEKAPPPPREPVPFEPDFTRSHYDVTFCIEGDFFKGDLGDFPTEWAALERARQLAHLTAKSMKLRNFWCLEHAISRRKETPSE